MGNYLGRARRCGQTLTVSTGDLPRSSSAPVHRVSPSLRDNSTHGCLNMADSLSFKDDEALADSQEHPGRVVVVHTQRYPVEKAQNLPTGVFPSVPLCGHHTPVPKLSGSRKSRSSVILNVVSTKGRATLRFFLGQPVLIVWSFLTGYLLTQSRNETWISARPESSKIKSKRVRTKKKKDFPTLGKGEGFDKQEEDSPVTKRPSAPGKDSDGDTAPSAFRRLIVKGVLSSFIPRPGPLGRDICSKNSAKSCIKESQIAFKSSYKRNAISSSYSSSLAQWPKERMYASAIGGAAPGAASGSAAGAAVQPTRGAAPDAAAGGTRGAAPDAAVDATRGAAPVAAAHATRGAAPDAAAGAAVQPTRGAAPDVAAGGTRGAAPDAAARVTGAAACASRAAAAVAAPGDAVRATGGSAPGAASGIAAGTSTRGTRGACPCAGPGALLLPSPASSQSKLVAKKGNEKGRSSSGNSKKKEKKQKKGKQGAVRDAQVKQGDPRKGLPISDTPRPVRRKIPLLLPHRRHIPLILPPAPELCFQITAEDFELEKKTAMQRINKVLKDDGAKARCN